MIKSKRRRSFFSLILLISMLVSTIGYIPLAHAATDAYSLIEAENFSSKSGTNLKVEACPDGGQSIGGTTNEGQYLVYNDIDFGSGTNGATKFSARLSVKGSNAGGNIEIRLDSPTGTLAGTLAVTATAPDNWNVYQTQSTDLTNITGIHNVYLVLKVAAGKTYVANINWVQFSKTLNSIAITTMPNKLAYSVGESLDITGMVVTGSYIDGTTMVEQVRASDVSGFNSSTATASQTTTVNVRGMSATYSVRIGGNSAYAVTEAESFSSKSGAYLKVESSPDGGQSVGGTNDGQYLVYNNIDFGSGSNGATKFSARLSVKGSNAGGNIEVRLDSPTGTLAGTLAVTATATDNWNVYQTQSTDLVNVTGVHDVYLVLKVAAGKTFVANINWFQFSKMLNSIAITTPPTKTVYRIGESLDLTGLAVTGTYMDGSTRVEQVRASDVSGFNSSTAAASQTLTVTLRGKTATYTVQIKPRTVTSITAPSAVTGVINGIAPTPAAFGLPSTVVLVTDIGNLNAFVNWNITASGYDKNVKIEQNFTVAGTVTLPTGIENPNNVPLTTSVNVTVLAAASPDKDTSYKFSFMAISDTHALKQGDIHDIALDNAMQDAVRNNAGSVSVAGDITDYGTDAQYDVVMNTMNKYPQVERNFAYGNHDVRWLGGIEIAKSRFLTHTGMPGIYFDKWINGYHFIYLGSEADDKDGAYISDSQLEWLKAKLAENASKDKPIFLFLHQPLEDTVSRSHSSEGYYSDEAQDQKVKDIVGKYPQSILITGHLHDDIRLPGNLYNEQYFTMIRDGAIKISSSSKEPGAQGLIFDIYADRVVINGRDVNTRSTIASWTITNYTADALSADTQAPTVPSNVTGKVVTDTMVTLTWDKSTDNFNGNVGVIGYDVYNGSTLVGSTTGNTSFNVTELTANTAYQFTVKARDAAGNVSNASSPFNVTMLAYDPAAINVVLNKSATTNGNVTGYDPSKAVDGSTTSGSKWSSSTTGDKWLMVDLGQNYNIARWVVKHAGEGGETVSLNTKNYKLQGSLDGSVWTDLDSIIGNVSNSSDRYITISTVRYVRLYITSGQNAVENGTANIYEFEVYGRSPDVQPPVTTATTDGVVGEGAWNSRDVHVQFNADDGPTGTGVNHIETKVDGGDWTNGRELTLTAEGKHSVEYHAIDNAGNAEAVKDLAIGIDKTAPETKAAITPSQPDGANGWYVHPFTVGLNVTDNLSGATKTEYSLDGGTTWQPYTSPVSFEEDGKVVISYRSTDKAGNVEAVKSINFMLDSTSPTILVSVPDDGSTYDDSGDLTPLSALSDSLSGVDNSKTTVTLDTYTYQIGSTTQLYMLPLGLHTLVISSSDLAGNQVSKTVHFQTVASIDSLKVLLTRFVKTNGIDKAGIANSLQAKLSNNDLNSFVNEVKAQSGKHITSEAATYLLRDAEYVISQR